jgi:hypothetical protein
MSAEQAATTDTVPMTEAEFGSRVALLDEESRDGLRMVILQLLAL